MPGPGRPLAGGDRRSRRSRDLSGRQRVEPTRLPFPSRGWAADVSRAFRVRPCARAAVRVRGLAAQALRRTGRSLAPSTARAFTSSSHIPRMPVSAARAPSVARLSYRRDDAWCVGRTTTEQYAVGW